MAARFVTVAAWCVSREHCAWLAAVCMGDVKSAQYVLMHAWLLSPLKMELGRRDQSYHEEVETELWEAILSIDQQADLWRIRGQHAESLFALDHG